MLSPVRITLEEKELLEDWRRFETSPLIRDRALAVVINSRGKSAYFIAGILSRQEETIRNWLKQFSGFRMASLFPKYRQNNNAGKLTPEQKAQIKQVLSQPPSKFGIPQQFWRVRDLKGWIKAEFGVVYESDRSYHFLFKLSRFNFKLPDRFDIKRNKHLVDTRLTEIRDEIQPYLASNKWAVLAADETRLVWESQSRRAWLKTNQKTILKVHRSHDYRSFLGGPDLKTGKCHLYSLTWQNKQEVFKALKKLKGQYPNQNICLVWDNASWHRSKLIRRALKKGKLLSNFRLINFPPYAPDVNPQEHVWKYDRDRIAHQPTVSFKQKINCFKLAVIHRKFFYKI